MTSHQYARLLLQAADLLYNKPNFEMETKDVGIQLPYDSDKAKKALRALGEFEKDYSSDYFFKAHVKLGGGELIASVSRTTVCKQVKKLQEVDVWECESIFGPEEVGTDVDTN